MNPWDLDATGLMIWGLVAHLVADWPLQNDWMANNKALRWGVLATPRELSEWCWYDRLGWLWRHPAAYVHASIHVLALALVFGWVVAIALGVVHLLIDTRVPVAWWSRLMRQTQPAQQYAKGWAPGDPRATPSVGVTLPRTLVDIGTEVRFWTDQVFHIVCIAVAALVVGSW